MGCVYVLGLRYVVMGVVAGMYVRSVICVGSGAKQHVTGFVTMGDA